MITSPLVTPERIAKDGREGETWCQPQGVKHRIHVNQHIIRRNTKNGEREAPLTCKSYRENLRGHRVDILDRDGEVIASVIHRPDKPLSCGARVWIETEAEVRVHDELDRKL